MWKLIVCFLVLDVYTRLYMTTIDRSSPGSQPDAWLPMISPFTSPEGACVRLQAGRQAGMPPPSHRIA